MRRHTTRKRPWLAAVFAGVVVGGGHLYLRRWRRALGWMLLAVGVAIVAVPESALEALSALEDPPIRQVAPMLAVAFMSIADAYVLARMNNARVETDRAETATATEDGDVVRCPDCGRETDADLAFCQWCTEPLPTRPSATEADRTDHRR